MIRTFQGITPTIPTSCFIEDTAVVIGDVIMGEDCSAWFHAVIRGDVNYIRIGNRTNVQDLCVLHVTHDTHPLILSNEVTIGHHVVLHGVYDSGSGTGWYGSYHHGRSRARRGLGGRKRRADN